MPTRPPGVPDEASWSDDDTEWMLGARDERGRLTGLVRYWRSDGTLVSECDHVGGVAHGMGIRFHESGGVAQTASYVEGVLHGTRTWQATDGHTTEQTHGANISKTIARIESDYDRGVATTFRYWDIVGRPVGMDGTPLSERPEGVPATAMCVKGGQWVGGRWTEQGAIIGRFRRWSSRGVLLADENHRDDGVVDSTTSYDDGPRKLALSLRDGRLDGTALAWRCDGRLFKRVRRSSAVYEVEDLDEREQVVRRSEHRVVAASAPPRQLPEMDELVLDAIAEGDASAVDAASELSPLGMAHAIAIGWAGDASRDARAARLCRRLVRRHASAELLARLTALGLDRAPGSGAGCWC